MFLKDKLCKEWNFEWVKTEFTLSGLHFEIDSENICHTKRNECLASSNTNTYLKKYGIEIPIGT